MLSGPFRKKSIRVGELNYWSDYHLRFSEIMLDPLEFRIIRIRVLSLGGALRNVINAGQDAVDAEGLAL